MDLNTLGILALGALGFYIGNTVWNAPPSKSEPLTPWNEQVGKTRSLQAKGDASLATEMLRRRTIQALGRINKWKIKESRTLIGSTTGAIETFMISGICPLPPPNVMFDGGGAGDEFCALNDDGSGPSYDAGNADTQLCDK
jgi:hypothetical protein